MENEQANTGGSFWFKIIITQAVFCIIVFTAVLITKYFFKSTFVSLKKWYIENVSVTTEISEVLEKDNEN